MATKSIRTESRMLEEVRRWRRQVYDSDRCGAGQDAPGRLRELAKRFGLNTIDPRRRATAAGQELNCHSSPVVVVSALEVTGRWRGSGRQG